jgi:hypothetical protein
LKSKKLLIIIYDKDSQTVTLKYYLSKRSRSNTPVYHLAAAENLSREKHLEWFQFILATDNLKSLGEPNFLFQRLKWYVGSIALRLVSQ